MQPKSILTLVYYIIMLVTVLAAMIGYRLAIIDQIFLDSTSQIGTSIYAFILMFVLLTIPYSLRVFHQKIKNIKSINNDGSREKYYIHHALIRLILIGSGLVMSIFAYFMLKQTSLIWLAGISAIALIFCRPNPARIDAEINIEETEEQESSSDQKQ